MTADEVKERLNVSRETLGRFEAFLKLLEKWQRRINLVSDATLADAWQRHILDSAQLARFYKPETKNSGCWRWCWFSWADTGYDGRRSCRSCGVGSAKGSLSFNCYPIT